MTTLGDVLKLHQELRRRMGVFRQSVNFNAQLQRHFWKLGATMCRENAVTAREALRLPQSFALTPPSATRKSETEAQFEELRKWIFNRKSSHHR